MTTPCSFPSVNCSFRVWNYSGQPFSPCALSPIGIGIQVGKAQIILLRAVESRNAFSGSFVFFSFPFVRI